MENQEIRYLGDMQRLSPKEGDVFVITFEGTLSDSSRNYIQNNWNKLMPEFKLFIIDNGMKLDCIAKD
jgi:hypothetical protein